MGQVANTGTTPIASQTFSYDALAWVKRVTDPAWGAMAYDRRADGQVTKIGHTAMSTTAYTPLDRQKLDLSGESGAGTVYEYYGQTENAGSAAPGALKSVTLKKGATVLLKV